VCLLCWVGSLKEKSYWVKKLLKEKSLRVDKNKMSIRVKQKVNFHRLKLNKSH
jgi:hypothetical protein